MLPLLSSNLSGQANATSRRTPIDIAVPVVNGWLDETRVGRSSTIESGGVIG